MPVQIAERWFETRRIDDDITLLWEPHVVPLLRCNIWHIRGRDRDLLVDTGMGICSLREAARHLIDKPVIAAATHTHTDHVGGHHEFDTCLVHRLEADRLRQPRGRSALHTRDSGAEELQKLRDAGYEVGEELITALPHAGYDLDDYRVRPANAAIVVEEGDVVDLGDRRFEILHLPGHSPGGIGLWEASTGTLFSGDSIYDGPLLDDIPGANVEDYVRTMERLRDLPVTVVHAGHDPSFGRDRLVELTTAYLKRRG
ncbi:MBL fold metallo-hydrolase [Azospirillum rugosum]|uniref:Glyoxylase-like metal-dependent hydrolase (Beta-lactamase superfamily II) n=1 Tax=Azospirillum rugosum TaxID=416170 RepID=A0ABS4STZ1_9PROT|nr:MBL fold metallo-hydrolase [Azospirillum rugosum]MBP2296031.1 glyoxylase-like metal-dependent hydrolase (beta-lactamase superfamily II) [Azospirillum rugosum]MDQ0529621.1 glyoxylase-like metal-dependent hydrolase (beta-lactamase superfamily II) [Azospirillum rugosum]